MFYARSAYLVLLPLFFVALTKAQTNERANTISEYTNILSLSDLTKCFRVDTGFLSAAEDILTKKGYEFDPYYSGKMYNLWSSSTEGAVTTIEPYDHNKERYFFLYFFQPRYDPNYDRLINSIKTNTKLYKKRLKNYISTYSIYSNSDNIWFAVDSAKTVVWVMNKEKFIEFSTPNQVYKWPPLVKQTIKPKKPDPNKIHFTVDFSVNNFTAIALFNGTVFEVSEKNKDFDASFLKYPWYKVEISDIRHNEYSIKLSGLIPNDKNKAPEKTIEIIAYPVTEVTQKLIFKLRRPADPAFVFNNLNIYGTCTLTVEELMKAKKLIVKIPGADYEYLDNYVKFPITSYFFTCSDGEKVTYEEGVNGCDFSLEMLRFIKTLKPGDKFYFEAVKVLAPDGSTRSTPTISGIIR